MYDESRTSTEMVPEMGRDDAQPHHFYKIKIDGLSVAVSQKGGPCRGFPRCRLVFLWDLLPIDTDYAGQQLVCLAS
jgi:hypothetical protein